MTTLGGGWRTLKKACSEKKPGKTRQTIRERGPIQGKTGPIQGKTGPNLRKTGPICAVFGQSGPYLRVRNLEPAVVQAGMRMAQSVTGILWVNSQFFISSFLHFFISSFRNPQSAIRNPQFFMSG
ncbi:MAG: hypothetical protein ACPGWR_29105 [Ardenticatenaceae bacterium]